jgi:large conductance mechanosensitive channel
MSGFKKFLLRGNVVELAVAVVMGVAFGAVVKAFTEGVVTPLIAAVGGQPDFSAIVIPLGRSQILIGQVLNALFTFLVTALVVYYVVVLPMTKMQERGKKPLDPTTRECPECLSEIPLAARRCAACGQPVMAAVTV